ncbi:MAG: outer membrane lipoprotein-sorting protein [Brevinema sp.]
MKALLILLSFIPILIGAQDTPASVLARVDTAQRDYKTFGFKSEMTIENSGRKLVKNTFGVARTSDESAFIEYTNPQDRGTRYLKLNKDMWIYSPDAQDVLKISGHLLRDSMMGSDISYNDMMERGAYADSYTPKELSTTNINGNNLWLLVLEAKNDSVSYARQDLFLNKGDYLVRKTIMYAKGRNSDRPIKEFDFDNYQKFGTVSISMQMKARDLRKKNSQTVVTYSDIKLDAPVEAKTFTRAYLER